MANLYRLIKHMRVKDKKEAKDVSTKAAITVTATDVKKATLTTKFPFLAIADNPEVFQM